MPSFTVNTGRHSLLLTSLFIAIVSRVELSAEEMKVVVSAGKSNRKQIPIVVKTDHNAQQGIVTLIDTATGVEIDAQISEGPNPEIVWILQRPLLASNTRNYRLRSENANGSLPQKKVQCVMKDGHLLVTVRGSPVLQYNIAVNEGPEGTDESQARNAYIHPLYSPDGQIITDDFAPDHVHQRGLFFAWTKSRLGDRQLNFWEVQQNTGRIVHTGLKNVQDGNVFGQFTAEHEFLALQESSTPTTVLKEIWTVRVYSVTDGFLIDLKSEQTCVADQPLVIGPYHYGGMAVRGRREWLDPKPGNEFAMVTSEGLDRIAGNHSRPQWVDFGGTLSGKAVGLISFCHPGNFRFPQPVRLHPTKPYFCFAPLVSESFQINPGEVYTSQYRFFVYSGDKDPRRAARLWADYADPPIAEVIP